MKSWKHRTTSECWHAHISSLQPPHSLLEAYSHKLTHCTHKLLKNTITYVTQELQHCKTFNALFQVHVNLVLFDIAVLDYYYCLFIFASKLSFILISCVKWNNLGMHGYMYAVQLLKHISKTETTDQFILKDLFFLFWILIIAIWFFNRWNNW